MADPFDHPVPLKGIDREVVQIPGYPPPLAIGDDGHIAEPGQMIIEDRSTRRRRRILVLAAEGLAYENIRSSIVREFHVSPATFQKDMDAISTQARKVNDDEDFMDIVIHDALTKLRKLIAVNFENANTVLDPNNSFDEAFLDKLFKHQNNCSKETRQSIETLVNLLGRRSKRWNAKQTVELAAVTGGSAEQQEAVRRMLGQDAQAEPTPISLAEPPEDTP